MSRAQLEPQCKLMLKFDIHRSKNFEKSFSRAICQRWCELHPILPHFDRLFVEYVDYRNMIPSFGAVMFSKGFHKILFSKLLVNKAHSRVQARQPKDQETRLR